MEGAYLGVWPDESLQQFKAQAREDKGRRKQDALRRALEVAKDERSRLAPLFEVSGGAPQSPEGMRDLLLRGQANQIQIGGKPPLEQQTAEQLVYGAAPGYGPDPEADKIESLAGRYESVPGWYNAAQFADMGGRMARQAADQVVADLRQKHGHGNYLPHAAETFEGEHLRNRHLMAPQQFHYMQDIGRTVDLLRGLRNISGTWSTVGSPPSEPDAGYYSAPEVALSYWDKSDATKNPGAIRSREDFNDPNYQRFAGFDKAIGGFMRNPDSPISLALSWGQRVPDSMRFAWEKPGDAAGSSFSRAENSREFGKTHMLNEENPVLRAPTPVDPNDSDAWTAALNQAGTEQLNLSPPPYQNVTNSAWRRVFGTDAPAAVGDLVGIIGDSADATGVASLLAGLPVRFAASGAAAAAKGATPSIARRIGGALAGTAYDEGLPEVVFGTAINAAGGHPSRTWGQYYTQPEPDIPLDTSARDAAHALEGYVRDTLPEDKVSIPAARQRSYHKYKPYR